MEKLIILICVIVIILIFIDLKYTKKRYLAMKVIDDILMIHQVFLNGDITEEEYIEMIEDILVIYVDKSGGNEEDEWFIIWTNKDFCNRWNN